MSTSDAVTDTVRAQSEASSPMVKPIPGLEAHQLTKRFDSRGEQTVALQDVDLTIAQGAFVSIIGPSGCGKSTMLRIFADLMAPTDGVAMVKGRTPHQARRDREFAMVFQSPNLLPWKSVLRNVTLPLQIMELPKEEREARAREMLSLVGLDGFESRLPHQLSGGMQQRVAIARALSMHPGVLFMDEPFGALDEITRDRLNLELMDIWQRLSPTVLFITHSIGEAVYLSTQVVVMSPRPGRITATIDIDLPYPRTASVRDQPRFYELVGEVRAALNDGQGRA
ncbi:MAG: ABC transporter ATP-binding protein [Acidimicrobiia bacterium]